MSSPLPPFERPTSPPPWPPAPPDPADSGSGRPRRRPPQGLVVAVSAVLGALAVLVGLLALTRDGDDDGGDTAAPTTTEPSATEPPGGPSTTTPPDTTSPPTDGPGDGGVAPPPVTPLACPAGVPGPICDAAEFVQLETGRPFRQFPVVELEDEEGFRARLLESAEEDLPELVAFGRTLSAIGLAPPDLDIVSSLRDLFAVGVVGFYEPDTDVLVVRGTEFSPYTRIVIVHELVHALDDQWFDIDRPQYDDADDEVGFGFSALVEGHARTIEDRFRAGLTAEEQRQAAGEELRMLFESDIDLTGVPEVLVEMLGAPYILGADLVEEVLSSGGQDAVAEAYGEPPRTSEQVVHPDRYLAGEAAVEVPAPPADGEVVEEHVMGEYGLQLWLDDQVAAEGWGGDRYVTWAAPDGGACTRMDLVMDSPTDLAEARDGFAAWAAEGARRTVEELTVAGTAGLRVTGCTP